MFFFCYSRHQFKFVKLSLCAKKTQTPIKNLLVCVIGYIKVHLFLVKLDSIMTFFGLEIKLPL